jgi:molecular chaperone Hsp33
MSSTDLENLPMDRAISAVTHDGSFRVLAVRSTRTTRGIAKSQRASGPTVENLADLASGTLLVRLTMAPNYRVQGIIQGAGGQGTLVADSWPDGGTRGLVRASGPVVFGEGARMQLMRSLPNGAMHQGIVEVSREHRVSGAVMNYLLESEQVTSALGVASVVSEEGEILLSGGYVVQLLPECTEPPLAVMYERLRHDFADLSRVLAELDGDPDKLVAEILSGMEYTRTLEFDLDFRCRCSSERVLASLATVGKHELEDMIRKAEPLAITCDYCRQEYQVQTEMLRGLLTTS